MSESARAFPLAVEPKTRGREAPWRTQSAVISSRLRRKDANVIDSKNMKVIQDLAEKHDYQVFLELVEKDDDATVQWYLRRFLTAE